MKSVYVLIHWSNKHVIGVYADLKEAQSDYNKFCDRFDLSIVTRDLIR